MSRWGWRKQMAALLVVLSLALFGVHYLVFRDANTLAFYTAMDIAFLPLQVLLVTFGIHELLERRQRAERIDKLNMVIGAFFSEVGNRLLRELTCNAEAAEELRASISPQSGWHDGDFRRAAEEARAARYRIRLTPEGLACLKEFLIAKRDFLLRLLENPNLLEHESFSDLLWAVFHLTEELESRTRLTGLPAADEAHLNGDAERAYEHLLIEWVRHAAHLAAAYPYLYSLLVRTNPLNPPSSAEVAG